MFFLVLMLLLVFSVIVLGYFGTFNNISFWNLGHLIEYLI